MQAEGLLHWPLESLGHPEPKGRAVASQRGQDAGKQRRRQGGRQGDPAQPAQQVGRSWSGWCAALLPWEQRAVCSGPSKPHQKAQPSVTRGERAPSDTGMLPQGLDSKFPWPGPETQTQGPGQAHKPARSPGHWLTPAGDRDRVTSGFTVRLCSKMTPVVWSHAHLWKPMPICLINSIQPDAVRGPSQGLGSMSYSPSAQQLWPVTWSGHL